MSQGDLEVTRVQMDKWNNESWVQISRSTRNSSFAKFVRPSADNLNDRVSSRNFKICTNMTYLYQSRVSVYVWCDQQSGQIKSDLNRKYYMSWTRTEWEY